MEQANRSSGTSRGAPNRDYPNVRIVDVETAAQKRAFINLPRTLYRNDPVWVPPLWSDERHAYDRERNPILANADFTLHLALRGDRVVGRNLVYVDHAFNTFNETRTGFFGAFECEDDRSTARALYAAAEKWLRERGMTSIRGPIHPTAELWGFVCEGFDIHPVIMSPYNPPYYAGQAESAGYRKVKDVVVYYADAREGYELPERFSRFAPMVLERNPHLRVRAFDPSRLNDEARAVWRVSNGGLTGNWGYVPVDEPIVQDMVRRLKPIVDPDAIWFVEDTRRPEGEREVGYALGFPDINRIVREIHGRLFPFGLFRMLFGVRRERNFRLFGLATLPAYHGHGLDVLLYVYLYRALAPRKIRLEANWILEDNYRMRNAVEKLGMRKIKTYRIFEKDL